MVPLHPLDEGGEAVEARAERRDPLKLVDDDAEVVEHVVERAGRLGDHAELDAARKVERRDDEDGQDLHDTVLDKIYRVLLFWSLSWGHVAVKIQILILKINI